MTDRYRPCEVAAATRKIDVQHDCAAREIEMLRDALKEAEDAMRFVYTSCATFPQEPQHIQNAAWRRIVNALTKTRAALADGETK